MAPWMRNIECKALAHALLRGPKALQAAECTMAPMAAPQQQH